MQFSALPEEIFTVIASHLALPKQVLAFARTCKRASCVIDDETVWKTLCERTLNVTPYTIRERSILSFKAFYRDEVQRIRGVAIGQMRSGILDLKCVQHPEGFRSFWAVKWKCFAQ